MILLDNMILAWGIARRATEGQEAMIHLAQSFLERVEQGAESVAIPAPALSEFLIPTGEGVDQTRLLGVIGKRFSVLAFDLRAAIHTADVVRRNHQGAREELEREEGLRSRLKVDAQIIGIALANGCRAIVSHDPRLQRMARGFPVEVVEMSDDAGPLFKGMPTTPAAS